MGWVNRIHGILVFYMERNPAEYQQTMFFFATSWLEVAAAWRAAQVKVDNVCKGRVPPEENYGSNGVIAAGTK